MKKIIYHKLEDKMKHSTPTDQEQVRETNQNKMIHKRVNSA